MAKNNCRKQRKDGRCSLSGNVCDHNGSWRECIERCRCGKKLAAEAAAARSARKHNVNRFGINEDVLEASA